MTPASFIVVPQAQDFFANLRDPLDLLELLEFLPQVHLYIKDTAGHFVHANRVVCEHLGARDLSEIVGKTDFDFFPPAIAAQYVREDRQVMQAGTPLTDQVWLVPGVDGLPRWYVSSKMPLWDRAGEVVGIAGVMRPYEQTGSAPSGYARLMPAIEFVAAHYADPIEVGELASRVGLSVSQLQRDFSRLFGITPKRYIREVRIGVARRLLESGHDNLAHVASHCGFYDQSHFTRQFKSSTGLTPREYRERYGPAKL